MMRNISIFAIVILMSCNQNDNSENKISGNNNESVNPPKEISGCYESIFGKDTTQLRLELVKSDSVKGALSIHYFQKDKSDGKFTGTIKDDAIIGWYDFYAEGKNSVRQIVFKILSDSLIEGYGNIEVVHDTVFFKNVHDLKYLHERPLIKISCP